MSVVASTAVNVAAVNNKNTNNNIVNNSNGDAKPVVQCSEIPAYAVGLIESIAAQEGFVDYTLCSTAGSNHGDGFLGIMVRVVIEGKRTQQNEDPTQTDRLALICKMPPADKVRREMFHSSKAFTNEIYAYDVMLPAMVQFQLDKGVAKDVGFFRFPKCYGTFADAAAGNYLIVLEDLRESGYLMWNKLETLGFDHARLAMAELGRLHALSFALRHQRPSVFAEMRQHKAEFMLTMLDNEMSQVMWKDMFVRASEALETNETEMRDSMRLLGDTFVDQLRECFAVDAAEPFGVMNHGDFWNNNMMYRYENDVPVEVCLIDWQLVQFGSPALDMMHFMYSSTEKRLRDQHRNDMLTTYCECLADALLAMGSDPNAFQLDDMQQQLQKFAKYGLIMAPMFIQMITTNPQDIPDLDEMAHKVDEATATKTKLEMDDFMQGNKPAYKKRVADVIRDFFAQGYQLH